LMGKVVMKWEGYHGIFQKNWLGKIISNGHKKPHSSPTHFMIVHMDQRIIRMICNMNDQIRKVV
jgi:hypothetical protein